MHGHNTNDCYILKDRIQDLIDPGKIEDPEKQPNIKTNPLPNYQNVPPPAAYTISLGLLESFIENFIQDIPKNETKKIEREERELLAILEVDFMSIINDSNDDEIDPSSY